jgi:hypothetical protein
LAGIDATADEAFRHAARPDGSRKRAGLGQSHASEASVHPLGRQVQINPSWPVLRPVLVTFTRFRLPGRPGRHGEAGGLGP